MSDLWEGETWNDAFLECPHCGHKMQDAWEIVEQDPKTVECDVCDREFTGWLEISHTYRGKKIND